MNLTQKKWTTILEIVDHETGENLMRHHIDRKEYIILKKEIHYNYENSKYNTRIITWICGRNPQKTLFGTD